MFHTKFILPVAIVLFSASAAASNNDSTCKDLVWSLLKNKISLNLDVIEGGGKNSSVVKADFIDVTPTSLTYRCDFEGDKITLYPVRNDVGS
ncbi:hypothetical protein [Enterobacter sichuanensis]|uniref:hypothetical protein n=1 Tax=Enterobacter sichuanensis TaxID=2071710 RepID=UPI00217D0F83|nr:hypothetical protein [Enterobacter sichuanensis]